MPQKQQSNLSEQSEEKDSKSETFLGWKIEKVGDHWKVTGHVNPGATVPPSLSFSYPDKQDVYYAIHKHHGENR